MQKKTVDAVLISHYHGDHVGHLEVVPETIPILMGEKAAAIYNVMGEFSDSNAQVKPAKFLRHREEFIIGDFAYKPFLVGEFFILWNGSLLAYY